MSEQRSGAIRVLVVTDQESVRDALRYGFPDDVSVSFVMDAREALRAMPEVAPSVVVVDLQTGSAGGYGLTRDMSEDPRWTRTPVIMLLERDQDVWLARQAGAAVALTKPIVASTLIDEIRTLVDAAASSV